ncbi:MAG: NAD+ synthase [Planctomycetes bacterium]|jgi:NAD+ synthetase|nr:NAD+ synthase [Planctomycetota bacterium]
MKIALAQINPTVGDIAGNAERIRRDLARARDAGANVVVFPELAVIGYPPKDLLLKPAAVEQCRTAVERLAGDCRGLTAIIGLPIPVNGDRGRLLHNAAAVCRDGRVLGHHVKSLLPTYDVFDEHRYFEPGPEVDLRELEGVPAGISICEDLWNDEHVFSRQLYHDNPIDRLAARGVRLFINCSASPFVVRKHAFRLKLMAGVAKRYGIPLLYCNQVGGNDELVFDGNSCVFDGRGKLLAHAKGYEEDLLVVDLDAPPSAIPHPPTDALAEAYQALVLGLRDYCRKCGFPRVVIGLSGGIDSAVTCAIAVAALGAENVRGVTMPSRYSSEGSVSDARALAENLGVRLDVIPIEPAHQAFESMLSEVFAGLEPDVTEENIQARARGVVMMAMSNKFGSLLVTTGNKSELAVGYCTLYGDMAGGFSVLSDVPKTMVYDLARWINDPNPGINSLYDTFGKPVIPEDTITKPPSAELRPDQLDQDSLPPYDVLDDIIERYVEREHSAWQIIKDTGHDAELVQRIARLIDRNEYKRKQAAPGLKITGRAFGFGRRMPIAQRFDNLRARPPRDTE